MNLNRKKVTYFRRNSRVVLPRAQSGIKESNLEVLRRELDQSHRHWMKAHCSCKGDQVMNLDEFELDGLRSLRKRVSDGEIVILPTDKIGWFVVMSMSTYIKAGEVHVEGDEEIRLKELKANQRQMNGHISILIKVFGIGKDWRQKQSISESMIGLSLSACPLFLLY